MSVLERSFEERLAYEYGRTLKFSIKDQEFIIGNGGLDCDLLPLASTEDSFDLHSVQTVQSGLREPGEYYLLLQGFDLVVMPPLRHFVASLNQERWRELQQEVCSLMSGVIEGKQTRLFNHLGLSGGFMSYHLHRLENGLFILNTLGNCACLGPEMYKTGSDENTLDHLQEFGLHNADTPRQRLSLYAGIGALAWTAESEHQSSI